MIREKYRVLKSVSKGFTTVQTYITYFTLLKKLIRKSKARFFEDKFKQSQADPRSTRGTINNILNRNARKQTQIENLQISNVSITDKQEMVNELNSYFTTIGTRLAAQIPQAKATYF